MKRELSGGITSRKRFAGKLDFSAKQVSTTLLLLLLCLLMPQGAKAGDWSENGTKVTFNFAAYPNKTSFTNGSPVTSSSGQSLIIINDQAYNQLNDYFAIQGTTEATNTAKWWIYNGGLCNGIAGTRTLSILKVFAGDYVTISYKNGSYTSNGVTYSSNIQFRAAGQADGQAAGTVVASGSQYTVSADGTLDLNVGRNAVVTKIEIKYNNPHVIWGGAQAGTKDGMPYYRYRLSTPSRDFEEPTPTIIPSGATVTSYSVENYGTQPEGKQVAVMDGSNVMFKNEGWAKVTATFSNGQTFSYLVQCWDNEAYFVIEENGTKYRLAKNPDIPDEEQGGVLKNRVVTAIPGVVAYFGVPRTDPDGAMNIDGHYKPNTMIVQRNTSYGDAHMVSFANDNWGWWDRYPHRNDKEPTQGTFYVFRSNVKGTLKFGGIKDLRSGNHGKVIWVAFTDEGVYQTRGDVFGENESGYKEFTTGIEMNPGDVYYVHGDAYDGGWSPFLLEWYSFEAEGGTGSLSLSNAFGVSDKTGSEIGQGGTITSTEVQASIPQGGSISIIGYKGNISSANVSIDNAGHIVFSDIQFSKTGQNANGYEYMGGAMKVRLRHNGESDDYYFDYVFTIPYGKHIWDFRNTVGSNPGADGTNGDHYSDVELANDMKNNTTDLSRVYKVHQRLNGEWTQLVDPLLTARGSVAGNNAFYLSNTNGLMVVAGAESFGTQEVGNTNGEVYDHLHGLKDIDDNIEYYYDYKTTIKADQMWLHNDGAKILFPGVKANQYIKVWCHRHSDGKGETFTAENLMDLSGKTINSNFQITGSGDDKNPRRKRGVIIFRVPADYVPTQNVSEIPALVLKDDGWARFISIEITDKYSTDQRSYITELKEDDVVQSQGVGAGLTYNSKGHVVYKNTASVKFDGYNNAYVQNAWSPQFTVEKPAASTVQFTTSFEQGSSSNNNYWRNLVINITGGSGNLHVIQEMVTGADKYVLDRSEFWLAVSQYHTQSYPYTWDFTAHNMSDPWAEGGKKAADSDATSPYARMATTSNVNEYGKWVNGKLINFIGQDYSQAYTATRNDNAQDVSQTNTVNVSNAPLYNYGSTDDQESARVIRPLFANGGELTYGCTTLKETEGLRIGLPNVGADWLATPEDFEKDGRFDDYVGSLELSADGLKVTAPAAHDLTSNNHTTTSFTIPEVGNGKYIFVKATAEPEVENAEKVTDKYDVADHVYLYLQNNEGQKDVVLTFSTATIEKIAVTDIEKSINDLGYATESRAHAIDHTYTGEFTKNDVNAYAITTYTEGEPYNYKGYPEVRKSENEVTVVPANTGIVLYKSGNSAKFTAPLFYPARNVVPSADDEATLANNWMAPNVESKRHYSEVIQKSAAMGGTDDTWCTKFIMTRKYYTYNKTSGSFSEQKTSNVEAFYRMIIDKNEATAAKNNTIGANKAYLLIPSDKLPKALWNGGTGAGKPGEAKNVIFIDLEGVEDADADSNGETTAIDNAIVDDAANSMEQKVYFSIDGTRIEGKPTNKGVYICNGKKVYVK